ncbi:MAG: hypothetical protein ABSG96_10505 [Terracidiphilus sp.]
MDLPARYLSIFPDLPIREVSYGCGGLRLFSADEVEAEQVGYSISPDGRSLCGDTPGEWRSSWVVIGSETGLGDPILIDTTDPPLIVFTAIHGEGSWEPTAIAISIEAFANIYNEFVRISKGRSNPVELEDNPLSEGERESYLNRIDKLNNGQLDSEFWDAMLEY